MHLFYVTNSLAWMQYPQWFYDTDTISDKTYNDFVIFIWNIFYTATCITILTIITILHILYVLFFINVYMVLVLFNNVIYVFLLLW
jgi:hypothetical protein